MLNDSKLQKDTGIAVLTLTIGLNLAALGATCRHHAVIAVLFKELLDRQPFDCRQFVNCDFLAHV